MLVCTVSLQDKPEGKLTDMWSDALSKSALSTVDVGSAFADLLSVKDENEIINVKKAAFMTASVMKSSTIPRLEGEYPCLQQAPIKALSFVLVTLTYHRCTSAGSQGDICCKCCPVELCAVNSAWHVSTMTANKICPV